MNKRIDELYPLLGAIAVAAGYWIGWRTVVIPDTLSNLLSAVVSIGGIAVGFLATAKSILIAIDDRPIIKKIREGKFYGSIIAKLRHAIRWSFILTIYSAALLLVPMKDLQEWDQWRAIAFAGWLFCTTIALLSYYRVSQIFYTILDHLDPPPTAKNARK